MSNDSADCILPLSSRGAL